MCIILVCDRSRPTEAIVKASWDKNDHGGGVAWQEDVPGRKKSDPGKRVVRWAKGLNLEEMQKYAKELPFPFIMHFRIASVGGRTLDLTHPFPLEPEVNLDWEGSSEEGVLFHNGHWAKWDDIMLDAVFKSPRLDVKLPCGSWSDSRAMTFLAYHFGWGSLEFIRGSRMVIMTPDPEGIYFFGDWSCRIPGEPKEGGGVLPSNDGWKPKGFHQPGPRSPYTTPPASMAGGGVAKGGGTNPGPVKEIGPPGGGATIVDVAKSDPLAAPGGNSSMAQPGSAQSATTAESVGENSLLVRGTLSERALRRIRQSAEKNARKAEQRMKEAAKKGLLPPAVILH